MPRISEPIMIRNVELKNRLYAPPMISNVVREDCCAGKTLIDTTYRRAKGGWGLVCSEGAVISETTRLFPRTLGIFDDSQVLALYDLVEAIHGGGAKAMIQLHHAGRQCNPLLLPKHVKQEALAPSSTTPPMPFPPQIPPRQLEEDEIWGILDDYAKAALRAKTAGYDMVLVHCSHGFLPQQFMSPFTNHRTDKWGGTEEKRLEFIRQLLTKMREAVGDYPIACRVAADEFVVGGYTIDDFCGYIAPAMEEAGCDMFDVTCGVFESFVSVMPEMYEPRGVWAYMPERIKKVVRVPVCGLGRINDGRLAVKMIEEGKFDIVGIGRGSVADPQFARKTLEGRFDDIRQCLACQTCMEDDLVNRPSRCAVNFEYNRDSSWDEDRMVPARKPKSIMVVGAGPAGLEFARVATLRGHKVTIYEKSDKLGGYLNLASNYPRLYTRELMNISRWLSREVDSMGIRIELNTEVTDQLIRERKPDAVILATGARETVPEIPGINGPSVVALDEVLSGKKTVGKRVAVVGGKYGAELAISLGREGREMPEPGFNKYHRQPGERALGVKHEAKLKDVTLIEEGPMVGWPPYSMITRFIVINEFLAEAGVKCLTETKVKEITDGQVKYVTREGDEQSIQVDTVVVATGRAANRDLYHKLVGQGVNLWEIGDCAGPEKVEKAIHTANYVARQI